jgi:hypothetical protein
MYSLLIPRCVSSQFDLPCINRYYVGFKTAWNTRMLFRSTGLRLKFNFCCFLGWGEAESTLVRRPLIGLLYQPQMIDDECGAVGGMRIDGGYRSTRREPAPVPLCPPHNLTWARTRATAMGSRRLTT